MPRTTDPALEEAGLDEDVVAGSLARVFGAMTGRGSDEVGDHDAWVAVVARAAGTIGGESDSDVTLSLPKFAASLRAAYGFALNPDYEPISEEALPPDIALAWQAVTRHVVNVFSFDSKEARLLERHEAQIVDLVKSRATATPK